jgi:hypothetical protein
MEDSLSPRRKKERRAAKKTSVKSMMEEDVAEIFFKP